MPCHVNIARIIQRLVPHSVPLVYVDNVNNTVPRSVFCLVGTEMSWPNIVLCLILSLTRNASPLCLNELAALSTSTSLCGYRTDMETWSRCSGQRTAFVFDFFIKSIVVQHRFAVVFCYIISNTVRQCYVDLFTT